MTNFNKLSSNNIQPTKSLSMKELYKQTRHIVDNGIDGYNLVKKYVDPAAIIRSREQLVHKRKLKELKRGSYLEDQFKIKRNIPGICTYNLLEKQIPKQKRKRHESEKKTFLDQEISNKNSIPAPGFYNVLQMMGSKTLTNNSQKKIQKKITYLDHAQYEGSLTPGVGQYIIPRNVGSKTEHNKGTSMKRPQQWKEYHKQIQKKSMQKIKESGPSAATYDPKSLEYQLFEQKKKRNRTQSQVKVFRQKPTRFRTQSQITKRVELGPGKYELLNQWIPKQKNKKGILSLISKAPIPSVYY